MTRCLHTLPTAALVASLLAACASAPPASLNTAPNTAALPSAAPATSTPADIKRRAEFDRSQDNWTGAKVRELVAKLGPPTSRTKLPDGSPVYVYAKSSKLGAKTTFSCIVRYLVDDRNERVTGHQIEGC